MVNWVLASESVCFAAHGHASMVFGLFWVIGYCSIALVAFIFPNWHHMVLVSSVPSLVLAVIFLFTIPESFHFLVEKGKREEIIDWIKKAERADTPINCDVDFLIDTVRQRNTVDTRGGFMVTFDFLIQNKRFIFYLVASTFMWYVFINNKTTLLIFAFYSVLIRRFLGSLISWYTMECHYFQLP